MKLLVDLNQDRGPKKLALYRVQHQNEALLQMPMTIISSPDRPEEYAEHDPHTKIISLVNQQTTP